MAWWESWFGEEYLDLYPHRNQESARREVAFALARLGPEPLPILDLCCGSGRHSVRFAERGLPPVGLDYSFSLLDLARERAPALRLVRADMRRLPFGDGCFRSVVNFFTSFGYFVREADNVAVVAEIDRVLAEGGRFLCDTFSLDYVLSRLVPEESRAIQGCQAVLAKLFQKKTEKKSKTWQLHALISHNLL
jgi:ubiquinone/menaquinone biosynthesis C-methylase UbiE